MAHDWREIAKEHGPAVWRAIFRILRSHSESLDCYQDVMLEAFEQSGSREIENWAGYLCWLAVHRALDRLRASKRKRQLIREHPEIERVPDSSESNASALEMMELKERLRSELTALPERQAEAFWLRFVEQMSYGEIADQMNLDSNAVGLLIHRARPRVRKALSDLQPNRR